ncbi:MAG: DUF1854 domain-containing protein [Patescibacteria group bacterium]
MKNPIPPFKLIQKNGKYFLQFSPTAKPKPVKIVWLQPFMTKNSGISILNSKKEELIYLSHLKDASADNQKIIRQALIDYTFLPTIKQIKSIRINYGVRYWDTMTDAGPHLFAMIRPSQYITHLTNDQIVVRDTFNNYYQIPSIQKLDLDSQKQLNKIL